jgi:hypothetical protein
MYIVARKLISLLDKVNYQSINTKFINLGKQQLEECLEDHGHTYIIGLAMPCCNSSTLWQHVIKISFERRKTYCIIIVYFGSFISLVLTVWWLKNRSEEKRVPISGFCLVEDTHIFEARCSSQGHSYIHGSSQYTVYMSVHSCLYFHVVTMYSYSRYHQT